MYGLYIQSEVIYTSWGVVHIDIQTYAYSDAVESLKAIKICYLISDMSIEEKEPRKIKGHFNNLHGTLWKSTDAFA